MRFFVFKSKPLLVVSALFLLAFLLMIFSPETATPTAGLKTTFAVNRYQTQEHLVGLTLELTSAPDNLDEVLMLLHEHNVTATFFATGEVARQSSDILLKIIDEGHEIALMGFSYTDQSDISAEQFRDGLRATGEQFDSFDIPYQQYYRPPYLESTTEMVAALSSFSFLTIEGDVLFFEDDMRDVATRVYDATKNLKTGSIIRMPPIDDETVDILEELFDILEGETKSAVKLSALLPEDGYTVSSEGVLSDGEI